MRTRSLVFLCSSVLLASACSDSSRVERPGVNPPSADSGVTADADGTALPQTEQSGSDAGDPNAGEPRRIAIEVEEFEGAPPEKVDPTAASLDNAIARGDNTAIEEAIQALEESGGPGAVRALGTVVKRHPDTDVRLDALELIGAIHEGDSVPPEVVSALDDADPDVRIEAIDMIADSEDVTMITVLESYAASEREEEVREVYQEAIEDLRDSNSED